jgi:hypothetical protein
MTGILCKSPLAQPTTQDDNKLKTSRVPNDAAIK